MQPIVIDVEAVAIGDVETYLEPAEAPANYKSPDAIAKYQAEARIKAIERAALDVDLARIVCVGTRIGHTTETVMAEDEVEVLRSFWRLWSSIPYEDRALVTFNGLGYDVPLILRRSLYLGIAHPQVQCDRFKHPQVIDLMAILNMDGKLKAHGLQFYLNRFGYPKAGPDITGADIAERYAAGDWAAIEQHCRMDVEATAWLAERIGAIPKRQGQSVVDPALRGVGAF